MSEYKNKLHLDTYPNSKDIWLLHTMKRIFKSTDKIINPHKYKFENNRDAAKFNTHTLKKYKFDFEVALQKEESTMLESGSEFRTEENI